ncbi:Glu/Leu/Phe/Val family dehydrogenase [Aeromicrobium chenweiae]|uniref:Valine dehydrogenase n=1 Tax=Aeromicrobium chenweiae TaxID=2079793 RepID=A0A2S0WHZ4_9ACTN|nr:Glu/Leu/Phe/Val dehydrogenase dimerization domain-containing protein [Aeromicrobium chenweiae]AWB90912.1 valine dehydrogenase [Aeromicrobium chenweiae]TGN32131.1 Glu/Leu/Phe/Val dehydrogenase [Aeromicrobium chenweiae]
MSVDVLTHDVSPDRVFDRTDELADAGHEQVVFCRDVETGLRAIISIHDTTLGPALGGTRFFPYRSEAEALTDGLRLAQGMTFKAAAAGMPLGGGKAVIIGDPRTLKTPELLRAYGRFIDTLGGRYISAADVGTTSDDLDVIGQSTRHIVGRTTAAGGSGDSGFSTAYGVFCAMQAAARLTWGADGLTGRTVGVEGAGKVGVHLIGLLAEQGASVVVSDPYGPALDRVRDLYDDVRTADSVIDLPVDVYAPCALGATLTPATVAALSAQVVCGAANNQLLTTEVGEALRHRGITWVPDFVANAGGLIQVGSELQDKTEEQVLAGVERIGTTVSEILTTATDHDVSTSAAALAVVRSRLDAARTGR